MATKMTRRNKSETDYQDVAGLDTFVHKPVNQEVLINDYCGYDEDPTSFDEYEVSERGDIGEYAALEYAKAQGYENVHPVEIDSADKGVDVVGIDPETRETIVIEAKTKINSDPFTKSDLNMTEHKGRQLSNEWIQRDNLEKLSNAGPGDSDEVGDKLLEGIDQTYGEVEGYRKEFVGVQVGEPTGDPVSGTLADVVERAYVTQLPASTSDQELQVDDSVAEDPWGADHHGFEIDNKAELAELNPSDEEEEIVDAWTDQMGETQAAGVTPPELRGEIGPTGPEDWDDSPLSNFLDVKDIGPDKAKSLEEAGYADWEDMAQSEEGDLQNVDGIGQELSDRLRNAADRRRLKEGRTSEQAADGDTSKSWSVGPRGSDEERNESGEYNRVGEDVSLQEPEPNQEPKGEYVPAESSDGHERASDDPEPSESRGGATGAAEDPDPSDDGESRDSDDKDDSFEPGY